MGALSHSGSSVWPLNFVRHARTSRKNKCYNWVQIFVVGRKWHNIRGIYDDGRTAIDIRFIVVIVEVWKLNLIDSWSTNYGCK